MSRLWTWFSSGIRDAVVESVQPSCDKLVSKTQRLDNIESMFSLHLVRNTRGRAKLVATTFRVCVVVNTSRARPSRGTFVVWWKLRGTE